MTPRRIYLGIGLIAAVLSGPVLWHEIDLSPPLQYVEGHYEKADGAPGQIITEAKPGDKVALVLTIKWLRPNCSSEVERRFIGSDGVLYKVPRLPEEPTELGPPPSNKLAPDGTLVSRRNVILPLDLPDGITAHSPTTTHRCDWPAIKWGDYITRVFPIRMGPAGAEIPINIKR